MKTFLSLTASALLFSNIATAQCADESNIYTVTEGLSMYEIVKENKTWEEAAACAFERGGQLVQIDNEAENSLVFDAISDAGVLADETVAPDGGGGAYLWIGATDKFEEGRWIWDGDNDDDGEQFWLGDADGIPTGGLYNNWGDEPDDFGSGQDGGAISINGWPLGVASEWNDVQLTNELFYIIEFIGSDIKEDESISFEIYPNPATERIYLSGDKVNEINAVNIYDISGKLVTTTVTDFNSGIDVSTLINGLYFMEITLENGSVITEKFSK